MEALLLHLAIGFPITVSVLMLGMVVGRADQRHEENGQ